MSELVVCGYGVCARELTFTKNERNCNAAKLE